MRQHDDTRGPTWGVQHNSIVILPRPPTQLDLGPVAFSSTFQDVNNDGFQDVILGESPASSSIAGAAYVVFGSEIFSAIELDISALDGTNGFKIEGTDAGDYAGTAVAGAGVSVIAQEALSMRFLKKGVECNSRMRG